MRDSGLARLVHRALIVFLLASGVLMAVAMIPLVMLLLIGIGIFSVTTPHKPRELTRRAILGTSGNGQ